MLSPTACTPLQARFFQLDGDEYYERCAFYPVETSEDGGGDTRRFCHR